jgi:SAM-dependent methyltransferase
MATMGARPAEYRFYGELAHWWPLVSPPQEYVEEAAGIVDLLATASGPVRSVLELGSGGGSNAAHLSRRFAMTLVDRSEEMLAVSRRLNPDSEHRVGDLRTVRLGRAFDAVLVHDAVDYLTSADDLRQAFETAFAHCRPGGVAVFMPDATTETFLPSTDCGGTDGTDGRGVRYLEWCWDPDPDDTEVLTEYAFLLRSPGGEVRSVHETHRHGLFPRSVWLRLLAEAGFDARAVVEQTAEERPPRLLFVASRPLGKGPLA